MDGVAELSRIRRLSDGDVLLGMNRALRASRGAMASVIALLGEVEERRLHLLAGQSSVFAYCLFQLAMSEDEACRRIDVARVARQFPLLLDRLENGAISLSVAALLKAHLVEANHVALIDAVSGRTVQQAREVLAAWFPKPDVVAAIRKLPPPPVRMGNSSGPPTASKERVDVAAEAADVAAQTPRSNDRVRHCEGSEPSESTGAIERDAAPQPAPCGSTGGPLRRPATSRSIAPLAPERYKVQFTADGELKAKIELASDLLRHTIPSGDLAAIIARALDALIEQTTKRRFGATTRRNRTAPAAAAGATDGSSSDAPSANSTSASSTSTDAPSTDSTSTDSTSTDSTSANSTSANPTSTDSTSTDSTSTPTVVTGEHGIDRAAIDSRQGLPSLPGRSLSTAPSHIPIAVRRAVLARDGMRCTWVSPDGVRCESRAWLEFDHIVPRGLGGGHDASNLRVRCRSHNRLAAEQAYGQQAVTRIIARRRERKPGSPVP